MHPVILTSSARVKVMEANVSHDHVKKNLARQDIVKMNVVKHNKKEFMHDMLPLFYV